uniref:BPTI/Kunitz inhibitor domain-containing protein n=1 Tax=Sphaeramia orbicularis TaxID=375764 RepID=A0A673C4G9_9TELE
MMLVCVGPEDKAESSPDEPKAAVIEPEPAPTKERCKAELQVGPCRAAFQRWYFNSLTGRCQRFIYGGCKGNKNNYENEESCRSMCTGQRSHGQRSHENCMVTSDPGPCRAAFPAFYYDHKTSTCRSFTYGGCRGNKNRYNTMEECTNRCSQGMLLVTYGTQSFSKNNRLSTYSPVFVFVGSCRAAFPRFFYNVTDQTCRRFTYGGCDANSNNFETKESCRSMCTGQRSHGTSSRQKKQTKVKCPTSCCLYVCRTTFVTSRGR